MILTIAAASAAIWVYLLAARGGFWRMRDTPGVGTEGFGVQEGRPGGPPHPTGATAPRIVAVIPARDEAETAPRAVASLAAQKYPGEFHIVLVDDGSRDGTAAAARAAAPESLLTVIEGAPLPAGWTGKLWAVSQGIREALQFDPDYVLLTDADIVHPPGNVSALTARAEGGGYDLVSYMATLECRTVPERALIPAFVFFFLMLYPPAWIRDRKRGTAGAAGGCILIRRDALERIGGLAAIRGEVIDDCALAAAVKRTGGTVWLGLSAGTRSVRRYAAFSEIGRMISRTAFTQLRYSAVLLAGTLAGLALMFLAPPLLAVAGHGAAARLAAGGAWLLMSIAYLPALRFYGRSPLWAPLLPAAAVFYMGATLHSAISYWRGTGGMWKGRACAPRGNRLG